ncbi:MAG TPA: hypothetical protein PLM53_16975 [Spirochaetota bacterium]|nr:hypothetical protein [Spirochaetota bacterium]
MTGESEEFRREDARGFGPVLSPYADGIHGGTSIHRLTSILTDVSLSGAAMEQSMEGGRRAPLTAACRIGCLWKRHNNSTGEGTRGHESHR